MFNPQKLTFLLISLLCSLGLSAQVSQNAYRLAKPGGATNPARSYDLCDELFSNGYMLAGSWGTNDNDIVVGLLNDQLDFAWAKSYRSTLPGFTGGGFINAITPVSGTDTGYVAVGAVRSKYGISGTENRTIFKVDEDGLEQWSFMIPGGVMVDAIEDPNSARVYALGQSPERGNDFYLCAINKNSGAFAWGKSFNPDSTNGEDDPRALLLDSNGDLVMTGAHTDTSGRPIIVLIKSNSSGTQLWSRTYSFTAGALEFTPQDVLEAPNGNYIVVSRVRDPALPKSYVHIMEVNTAGTAVAFSQYVSNANNTYIAREAAYNSLDQFFVAGISKDPLVSEDGFLLGLNAARTLGNFRGYSQPNVAPASLDRMESLDILSSDTMIATGNYNSFLWLVKAAPNATATCDTAYGGVFTSVSMTINTVGSDSAAVGPEGDSLAVLDYTVEKFDECDVPDFSSAKRNAGTALETAVDPDFSLAPNPSTGQVTLSGLETAQTSGIAVYDLSGKQISNFRITASTNQFTLDLSALAPGVYVIEVNQGNGQLLRKKLILNR